MTVVALCFLAACTGSQPSESQAPDSSPARDDTASASDTDPADTAAEGLPLPTTCDNPADLAGDPLEVVAEIKHGPDVDGLEVEFVDAEVDGTTLYGAGQGGLLTYDISDPADPTLLSVFVGSWGSARYHRVEPLADGLVALSHRERGFGLVDMSDPSDPAERSFVSLPGAEGLAWSKGRLYVTVRGVGVMAFDVSDPAQPRQTGVAEGLSSPWELTAVRNGWTYVADNTAGLVPVYVDGDDISIGQPVELGGVLHAVSLGSRVYAALGGAGIAVLDASDPSTPVEVARLETGGSVLHLAAADGTVWAADQEGLVVVDATTLDAPRLAGREATDRHSLAVAASSSTQGFLADWNFLVSAQYQPPGDIAVLDPSASRVALPTGGGTAELDLTNRGTAPLELHGAHGEGVTITAEALEIAPGDSTRLWVDWDGTTAFGDRICLVSNAPNERQLRLELTVDDGSAGYGITAPDFVLEDTDGNTWQLGEQRGSPVLLAWFATW